MKRTLLVALTAASLLRAEAALAGSSCGGGGGGGGGGGAASGGGGGAPPCIDDTDVVGYRRCEPFAAWSDRGVPRLVVELGAAVRAFESRLGEAAGGLARGGEPSTLGASGRPAGAETAEVGTLRVGVGLGRGFYLAGDGELGRLVRTAARAGMAPAGGPGTASIAPRSSVVLGLAAAAGLGGAVGRVSLGVEVAGGVRALAYRYRLREPACVSVATHAVNAPILEARARASYWLSPFVSVGASVGASVIERGAWMAGVQLGFATRAFGGLRD